MSKSLHWLNESDWCRIIFKVRRTGHRSSVPELPSIGNRQRSQRQPAPNLPVSTIDDDDEFAPYLPVGGW